MRKFRFLPSISALLAVCSAFGPLQAQSGSLPLVHDRVVAAATGRASIPNTVVPRARRAADLGAAPANTPIQAMTLRFSLTDAQTLALSQLEAAQQNPASASYHQWLTPEQYAAQFGVSTGDLASITAWLQAQGFTGIAAARSRSFITFSGTAAQVNAAFATSLHTMTADGEQHFANLTDPTLPSAFAGLVGGITGLNDFRLKPHAKPHTVAAPNFTSALSGSTFIAPGDFYTIYDTNPLLNASINGTGVTIGVMGQTDIALTDIAAFRSASGLAANAPTVQLYGRDPGTSTTDLPEASLDVEWSGAVAPAATILYVNSTDVIAGSLTQAIDNNLAPILTISYGDCESGFGSSNIAVFNQLFRQATVQGQTILGPAGDSGATDCDYDALVATQGLAVDFPASSPYVTGVGGTMFNENGGTYFSAGNGNYQGSALSDIPEAVWNETSTTNGIAAGGGGISAYFTKPSWQVGTGVPADFSRDVPDVAFNAAANHDGYLFCTGGFCTNGFRNAASNLDVVGGTSVATPAYAGIMALLEQKIQARVGNANPTIYGLANSTYYSTVFHDTTVGNNASPCTVGSTDCATSPIGYSAGAGYDLATGWGSVDAANMVADWLLITPAGITSTSQINTSSTALTASANSAVQGTAVTLNVQVASSTQGVATIPTGTVQLLIDRAASGSAITLVNGTATITLPTTTLASGNHIIGVSYSGDSIYIGSKGAVNLDITSVSAPDFTISPATGSLTVKAGSTSAGLTFTVTPTNGFIGLVNFAASSNASGLAFNPSFSPPSIALRTTASGSTVFTIGAFALQAITSTGKTASVQHLTPWKLAGTGIAMAGLLFFVIPGKRRRWSALAVAILSVAILSASGCGDTSTAPSTTTASNTAPGTYNIVVAATGTTSAGAVVTHNVSVTFIVQ